jgi:cytochrome P450 / NADPH-cytochrome P450 reductase
MTTSITHNAIPRLAGLPILGNIFDVDRKNPIQGLCQLAQLHGPIFRLNLPGRTVVVVSDYTLVNELCDEQRFDKLVWTPLRKVRKFAGDGLFTAWTFEPNWSKAHHILLPTFRMKAMQAYLPMMVDIAEQLMLKWERLNPDDVIDVPDDMTRLTLDTIGLCGFAYRFNSFYREESHPFVKAMVRALAESLAQLYRLPIQDALMFRAHRQYEHDIAFMNTMVDTIIQERKACDAASNQDLLSYMLTGIDKQTGERLDDINIRHQIITFLIAGHETTSGLLSFALYFLLKHPETLDKAYDEVDRVLGRDHRSQPSFTQVQRLTYVQQILKESLRLWPPAPAFALYPYVPTILGGKYEISKDDQIVVLLPVLHRDPSIWGVEAATFDPDHFSPERERVLARNAYKPFGNGHRACIGRQFAMLEATLVLGMILQRFELIDHADYQLDVKETLTLKPANFTIKVRPRPFEGRSKSKNQSASDTNESTVADAHSYAIRGASAEKQGIPLLVLYGSNLGMAEALAQEVAADAEARGFVATTAPLNDYVAKLPSAGAVVIVSSSYNGAPPDNAELFCQWLCEDLPDEVLAGVRYTVFGCGDRNWSATFQAVPKLIDDQFAAHGAQRVYPRGEGDTAGNFDGQFRAWYTPLWDALAHEFGVALGARQTPGAMRTRSN